MADSDYNVVNYQAIGGKEWVIGNTGLLSIRNGGALNIETGGALKFNGVDMSGPDALAIAGVAAGYKIARGEVTLDGTNPTPITTGLATVVAAVVCHKKATTPGLDPTHFTVDYGGAVTAGELDVYAWKPTASGNVTLIASTDNASVISWIAIGT